LGHLGVLAKLGGSDYLGHSQQTAYQTRRKLPKVLSKFFNIKISGFCLKTQFGPVEYRYMKNWICYNLFGENPDNVDTFGMISSLCLLSFLFGSWIVLFVVAPLYIW